MSLLYHLREFAYGILSRWYFLVSLVLIAPTDLYGLVKQDGWPEMTWWPNEFGWVVAASLVIWAAFNTYHDVAKVAIRRPNWKHWDAQVDLEVWEVACLLEDVEPILPLPRKAMKRYKALEQDIENKRIIPKSPTIRKSLEVAFAIADPNIRFVADPKLRISRGEIARYADARGEKPKLLHPGKRL